MAVRVVTDSASDLPPDLCEQLGIEAASTTASGQICIELIAVINKWNEKITCRDTICFRCDPAPKVRCDSMSVKATAVTSRILNPFRTPPFRDACDFSSTSEFHSPHSGHLPSHLPDLCPQL